METSDFLRLTGPVVLAAAVATGCATARAAAPREVPALDVPPPPPRILVPLPSPQPPPLEPVADLPGSSTPPPARPRPQRQAEPPSKTEAKTEEKADTPPNAVAPPVPQLRMPDGGNSTQVSAQIRDSISRTRGALENIDYRTLSQQRQKAYDDAKLFSNQAEEALKSSNLVVAKELADKAERLARELQNR